MWSGCPPQTLAYGIDGWKCDAAEPYMLEIIFPLGEQGLVTRRKYSEAYYADIFDYTRQKLGNDRLIMSRAVDGSVAVFPCSLPGLPCFCSSVCIQYNTRKRKSGKNSSSTRVLYWMQTEEQKWMTPGDEDNFVSIMVSYREEARGKVKFPLYLTLYELS